MHSLPANVTVKKNVYIIPLVLLFLFLTVKAVIFAVTLPPWQGHDEPAHFSYTQYLVEEKRLPNDTGPIQPKILSYSLEYAASEQATGATRIMNAYNKLLRDVHQQFEESKFSFPAIAAQFAGLDRHPLYRSSAPAELADTYYQLPEQDIYKNSAAVYPPLYYAAEAVPYLVFYKADIITRMYAMRIFSTLMFVAGFFVCYLVVRRITKKFIFSAVTTLAIGSLPVFSHLAAGINNDALLFLLTTLAIYWLVRLVERAEWRTIVWLGITLGLGLLTKPQFIVMPALVVIPFAYHLFVKKDVKIGKTISTLIVCALIALAIGGWWYGWAYANHNGIFQSAGQSTAAIETAGHIAPSWQAYVNRWLYAFASFNFAFGFATEMSIPMPLFIIGTTLWMIAALGIPITLIMKWQKLSPEQLWIGWLFFSAIAILELFYLLLFSQALFRHGEARFPIDGRYYAPVLLPVIFFWLYSLTAWLPKKIKTAAYLIIIIYSLSINISALTLIMWPKFYL